MHVGGSGLGPPVVGHVSTDLFGISSVRLVLSFVVLLLGCYSSSSGDELSSGQVGKNSL